MSKYISNTQAESTFAKLDDRSPQIRAAALQVCSSAMQSSASLRIDAFLAASRDPDSLVWSAAADAFQSAIGFDWKFRKEPLAGFAKTRAEHNACKEALLALRADPSSKVRDTVRDVLELLDYKEDHTAEKKRGKCKVKDDDDDNDDDDDEPSCCDAPRFNRMLPPAKFISHTDGGPSELWRCLNCEQGIVGPLERGDRVEDNPYSSIAQQLGKAPPNRF